MKKSLELFKKNMMSKKIIEKTTVLRDKMVKKIIFEDSLRK